MSTLDARLLEAHDRADGAALVHLYAEAADRAASPDAAGFYLTQAHVFAMELGHPMTPELRRKLVRMGREEPL